MSIVGELVGVALGNPATSAATAWAKSARAPLRSTSVSGSESVPGWESWKTLLSVTAYHSFSGEVEARTPPRYAALPFHAVTNFCEYLCCKSWPLLRRCRKKPANRRG